jgi:Alkylmercury lyase
MQSLDLDVRAQVYDAPMNGRPIPRKHELAAALDVPLGDVEASFQRLAAAHMLVLQPESGEVLMANPFSAVPTPFLVRAGDRSWYGNCIWDSMGIAAMLNTAVSLETSCGCCGSEIVLNIPDDCRSTDERVAHFAIPAAHWWDDIVFN